MLSLQRVLCGVAIVASCGLPGCDQAGREAPVAEAVPPSSEPAAPAATPSAPVPAVNAAPTAGGPQLTFAGLLHDFGEMTDQNRVSTRFAFTNSGTQTLILEDPKSTCGCTVPKLTKHEYAPGEQGSIDVTFNPSGRSGLITKSVKVLSNANEAPVDLTVQALVRPVMRVEPRIMRLGVLRHGQEHTRTFEYFYTDPELVVTSLEAQHPDVSLKVLGTEAAGQIEGLQEYRTTVEIIFSPNTPWGLLEPGGIDLVALGRPWPSHEAYSAAYKVFVSAQFYGDVVPQPAALVTRGVTPFGQEMRATCELKRTSGQPLVIHDARIAESNLPDLELSFRRIDDSTWRLVTTGTGTVRGAIKGIVTIQTNVPGEEVINLGINGFVK